MTRFLLICLGGAIGTGARYLIAIWAASRFGSSFPIGTLFVNVIGSFLLGAVIQLSLTTNLIGPDLRLALTTGVLGGFTTYSTFNYETLAFTREGAWAMAMANAGLTVFGCLAAGMLGVMAARVAGP